MSLRWIILIIPLFVFLSAGCDRIQFQQNQNGELTVREAGTLGAKLYHQSEQHEQVLKDEEIDSRTLKTKIREISSDPALSKKYRDSFEKTLTELRNN